MSQSSVSSGQRERPPLVVPFTAANCSLNRWHPTPSATGSSSHSFRSRAFRTSSPQPQSLRCQPPNLPASPRTVRTGSPGPRHPRGQLSLVPDGMEAVARPSARHGEARLSSCDRAWRDRNLSVLLVAQRALRSTFGETADGAGGRRRDAWWPDRRCRRRAGDGTDLTGSAVAVLAVSGGASMVGAVVIARRMPARHSRCPRMRIVEAPGPRSGACPCCGIWHSWSRSPLHSPDWWITCSRRRRSPGLARAIRSSVSSASFTLAPPWRPFCCKRCSVASCLLGLGWVAPSQAIRCWWARRVCSASSFRRPGVAFFRAALT